LIKYLGELGLDEGVHPKNTIHAGDALDFWRVLYAHKPQGRLVLYAEMKLPGEAWLEYTLENNTLVQTATFRPLGVLGRLYWFAMLPFHGFIFKGMIKQLTKDD
jgi:hypothetical protein